MSLAQTSLNSQRISVTARAYCAPAFKRAVTLLEMTIALSLMSVITVVGAQTVRTSWKAWGIQDQRSDVYQHLEGTLDHITRELRKAKDVVAVSDSADTSGFLTITLFDDSVVKWDHDNVKSEVLYGIDPPTDLLAMGIDTLLFECFMADGITPTVVPAEIQMVRATASVTIPVQGTSFALTTTVWIRTPQGVSALPAIDFYATQAGDAANWENPAFIPGPPDGQISKGDQDGTVTASGFDASAYTGDVGTVLVGLYQKYTANPHLDILDVQLSRISTGSLGPVHSFAKESLTRAEVAGPVWFWVEATDDFGDWTFADITDTSVKITWRDAGKGNAEIELDSVKISAFRSAPTSLTYWMTGLGVLQTENKWADSLDALGVPNGTYASSNFEGYQNLQVYGHIGTAQDLGTIIGVRAFIDFFVSEQISNDFLEVQLYSNGTDNYSGEYFNAADLNKHIASDNQGIEYREFVNHEVWTWAMLNSLDVWFKADKSGGADGDIYVDAVGVEVRYAFNSESSITMWEEP